jgi:hypothetical protein
MTPNTSIEALSGNFEHRFELEEEQFRDTHLVECHGASYRPSPTVQRTDVQQGPSRIEERSKFSFLRFRDEWVRNRAREIQRAESISFSTCSEDTASITALNEFYRWRVFDGFKAEHRDEKELKIGMIQGSRAFGRFPKDVTSAEKHLRCRIVCREKGRRVFKKDCRRVAESRV